LWTPPATRPSPRCAPVGAKVTDVVVLVVAADDGVMEQTKEAIAHSKAAGVPILVAVNKIDKPGAEPDRVRRELAEYEPGARGLGRRHHHGGRQRQDRRRRRTISGDAACCSPSFWSSKANPDKGARGTIFWKPSLDKGRGAVATVLVQEGTLKRVIPLSAECTHGKVRACSMTWAAGWTRPVPPPRWRCRAWAECPRPATSSSWWITRKTAKQVAEHRAMKKREAELSAQTRAQPGQLPQQDGAGRGQGTEIGGQGRCAGQVEALKESLGKLGNEEVKVDVIQAATGAITETDVMLASASEAIIIGFNVRPTGKVSEVAEAEHVEIRTYEVIYHVIEEITAALTGMLAPIVSEEVIGHAEVRETFKVPKIGNIAGSYVTDGKVERNSMARLLRDGVVIANTKVSSLRRFKDDAKEVAAGL
jgi:translation initiation factor IF-2